VKQGRLGRRVSNARDKLHAIKRRWLAYGQDVVIHVPQGDRRADGEQRSPTGGRLAEVSKYSVRNKKILRIREFFRLNFGDSILRLTAHSLRAGAGVAGPKVRKVGMARQIASGDFATNVLPHLDAGYNLARWIVRNDDDAKDIVQESAVRAITYYGKCRVGNARNWFLQIVRNVALDALRRKNAVVAIPIDAGSNGRDDRLRSVEGFVDPGDNPESALIRDQQRRQVDDMIASLPVDLREVLVLRELEAMAYKEIADVTGSPVGTVMSRLWRARRMMAAKAVPLRSVQS
jgi:RNA polymerase sigma factor (sigma-70 family)